MPERISVQLPVEGLLFWKLSGSEEISRPFVLDISLLSSEAHLDGKTLLGQPITVTIPAPNIISPARYLNGKVTAVSTDNTELSGMRYALYSLRMESDLWPLQRDRNQRIFQNQRVPDIIKTVLSEYGVLVEDRLTSAYRCWEYCVQYQESSYNFIARLMELEGIYYFFRHAPDQHTLVLMDAAQLHQPYPGYAEIPYHAAAPGSSADEEGISQWVIGEQVTPGICSIDDYDFRKPNAWLLQARQNPVSPRPGQIDHYQWPGRFVDHRHGEFYVRIRQEIWQAQYLRIDGRGNTLGIVPGHTFTLMNPPCASDSDDYLVVSAAYLLEESRYASGGDNDGIQRQIHFVVIPADITFRAAQCSEWPRTCGPQTARVVGPKGESIWTDKYGRVKVKFHWDRLAKGDDTSSCWVRVSSAWAGQGFGGVQIPRVGDEVIVDFINGDPDRPIITGRLYNEASMPPWALPAAATQMGFISRSKHGTPDNANALRFEDKQGAEQLWIQAERNLDVNVKQDASRTVGNNHSHYVGASEFYRVANHRLHGVKGDEECYSGKGKTDVAVESYVIGSGVQLRLECGESVIELNADGRINLTGKEFNFFAEGDGYITAAGGILHLNSAGSQPGTRPPGDKHKTSINNALAEIFAPQQQAQLKAAGAKVSAPAAKPVVAPLQNSAASTAQKAQENKNKLHDDVVKSIMTSEGRGTVQGGIPEVYGFRKGFSAAFDDITAVRKKYGVGSHQEFVVVSNYMTQSAVNAGALNFTDPGKQAAVMSLAHMRGVGGAQAILNSMQSGEIVRSATLTSKSIDFIEALKPDTFQEKLKVARLAYDKEIYGNTTTFKNGAEHNWWDYYQGGLRKRYDLEANEFLKLSGR
ncbi:type VI secretion system Vgr family protein [Pantoea sp. B65]|uniref:type VI secretion system Vgr family protein n=1 Tax=Pantoea sp. B65 TaxID=2813359 RepID=UPI0039B4F6BB